MSKPATIKVRIDFKLLLIVFKALHEPYITDLSELVLQYKIESDTFASTTVC